MVLFATLAGSAGTPPVEQSVQRRPIIRGGVELIYVNVVVRDGNGNIVRNLKKEDFTLVEDDKSQTITAFDFEEVPSEAISSTEPAPVQPILKTEAAPKPAAAAPTAPPVAASKPESIDLKNRRLVVLLFDSSSMQPEELERAIASGYDYISKRLTPADLVAIASVGSTLQIVQDFTADRETLSAALDRFSGRGHGRVPGRHDPLPARRPKRTDSSPMTASSTSSTPTAAWRPSSSCPTLLRRSSRRSRLCTSAAA